MNKLVIGFGMGEQEAHSICDLLSAGNYYTGEAIWQRLNEAGYFIVPQNWLLANVKADKLIRGQPAQEQALEKIV